VNIHTKTTTDPATAVSPAEWQARVDLAAVYRLVAHHGWDDGIYNHVRTPRIPAQRRAFFRPLAAQKPAPLLTLLRFATKC
jgi:hypothetical protein